MENRPNGPIVCQICGEIVGSLDRSDTRSAPPIRLAVYFSTTPEFWLNLQTGYELKVSRRDLLPKIQASVRPFVPQCPAIS
jgi:hypothetical protein